jgi:predicted lipoprotein with Yx(FWY)xxD motif
LPTSLKFLLPTVATAVLISACGSSSSSSTGSQTSAAAATGSSSSAALVKTATNAKLGGSVLTTAQGMTLYRLTGEKAGKFICTSKMCVGIWHPLAAQSGSAPTGSGVSSLGTVKRPDGTEQVSYKGEPLYTFVKDTSPGQANGQGIKDVGTWEAVMSGTAKAAAPAAPAAPATTTRASGGYAY